MSEENDLPESLEHSIEKPLDKSIMADFADVAVSHVFDAKLLDEVPVVKTIASIAGATRSIRDRILAKKLVRFLSCLSRVSAGERALMVVRLRSEPDFEAHVGERILEILDRIDSHQKPTAIGRIFGAYALQEIDAGKLRRLVFAVESLPSFVWSEVRTFRHATKEERHAMDSTIKMALANAGLARARSALGDALGYEVVPLLDEFISIVLSPPEG